MANHESLKKGKTAHVYGGGGTAGLGWLNGMSQAFIDRGADMRSDWMVGTSAGSINASFLAAGIEFEDVMHTEQFGWPRCLKPGFLQGMLGDILGDARASNVNATGYKIHSPEVLPVLKKRFALEGLFNLKQMLHLRGVPELLSRDCGLFCSEMLNGGDYDLADICAASSSVPFVFAPVQLGGNYYVDGGVESITHVGFAPDTENVVVLAPMAEHFMPPFGPMIERGIRNEMGNWQLTHPDSNVILIRANRRSASKVKNPLDVFSVKAGKELHGIGREQGHEILDKYVQQSGTLTMGEIACALSEYPEFTVRSIPNNKHAA